MADNALIVLIVDDNEAQRYALQRSLLSAGFRTQEAATGNQAIESAQAQPDVVLLDINLPDISGFEVCRVLKSNPLTASIPVVQMSAHFVDDYYRMQGFAAGADDYLVHPIARQELTAKLTAWGRVRRAEAESRRAQAQLEARVHELQGMTEQLKTVFDSVPATIWYKDTKNNFLRVNHAAAELTGKRPDEIEGRSAAEVFPAEADKYYADDLEVIASGRPKLGIVEPVTSVGGEVRWVRTDKIPIANAAGQIEGLVAFAVDITERKRAEDALAELGAESERRRRLYETVLSNTPDLVYVFDLNHRFTYANDSLLRMWGRTWQEAIGKNCLELGYEPWHAAMHDREIDQVIATKQPIKGEVPFSGTYGRRIYEYIFVPVLGADGAVEAVAGTTRDVTDRQLAETALQDSEQRVRHKLDSILSPEGDLGELELADIIDAPVLQTLFERFYNFARIPMAIIDLKGKVLVGVGWQDICVDFHRVNAESCKHCIESDIELSAGVTQGQYKLYHCKNHMWDVATPLMIGGKHMGNLFTGQFFFEGETPDVELFRAQARQYGFDEQAYLAALDRVPRLTREDLDSGMAYFMQLADMISQLSYSNIKLARSLAERDALTDALRHSEQRFRTLSELVPQMIWTADEEGNIDYVNERWRQYTGQAAHEPMGVGSFAVVHPEDFARMQGRWSASVSTGIEHEMEVRLRGVDGQYRWFLVRGAPVRDAKGRVQRWFGTCTDIHDLKIAQQALIRQEKLASVGRMAATIAHEINNPLAASINALYLAETEPNLPAKAHNFVKVAEKELERVAHITKQTLGFYRENGNAGPVRLDEVIDGVLELYKPKLRSKGVSVVREYRAAVPVRAIEGEVRQIVSNLVANSIDALPHDGVLRLRTSICRDGATSDAATVRLTVADTGAGIPAQDLKHVFEPFFSTKTFGTGLGLWVTRELVAKQDGSIRARSLAGKGTVFSIWLPTERRTELRVPEEQARE